jgi:hypothetical protein
MTTVKRECMVMLLPTKEKAKIYTNKHGNLYIHPIEGKLPIDSIGSNYHFYIFSLDKPQVGDWCILLDDFGKVFSNPQQYLGEKAGHTLNNGLRKIIASTDPSLGLPQPSPQFIQKYVELFNKGEVIEKCLVSYERVCSRCKSNDFDECWSAKECSDGRYDELRLLVDKNNYITITKVKDSLLDLCKKDPELMKELSETLNMYGMYVFEMADKDDPTLRGYEWIKENL